MLGGHNSPESHAIASVEDLLADVEIALVACVFYECVGAVVGAAAVAIVVAVVAVAMVCLHCYSNLVGWLGKVAVVVANRGRRRVVVLCQ